MPPFIKRRRVRRLNSKWDNYLYAMKKQFGMRVIRGETRNNTLENTQNMVKFQAIARSIEKDSIEGYLATATGEDAKELGLGTYATDKYKYRWFFHRYVQNFHFRNIGEHPCFLTIYEVVLKNDRVFDATINNGGKLIMDDLADGWALKTGAGASAATSKSGETTFSYSAGNDYLETYGWNAHLKDSETFMNNWKVIAKRAYKLNPGDDVKWKMISRKFIWDPTKYRNATDSSSVEPDVLAGITKVLFIKFTGVIGRSNIANEDSTVGFMQADIYTGNQFNIAVTRLNQEADATMITVLHDDLTGKTLVGPGDVTLYDDAN